MMHKKQTFVPQTAAKRLMSAGRIPINIWGDVMLDGSDPQIRHVLTGQSGHESLLTFFYFGEILALNDGLRILPELESTAGYPISAFDRLASLVRISPKTLDYLKPEIIRNFASIVGYVAALGEQQVEICELGSTFCSAVEKLKLCARLLDVSIDFTAIPFSAIDHSDYFTRGAKYLHRHDNVRYFQNYEDWTAVRPRTFFISRFVASYAFSSTAMISSFLGRYSGFYLIDVVNLEGSDFTTSNNGLAQIFLDLPRLVDELSERGWSVFLQEITPDFNSGRRCAVVKLLGMRNASEQGFAPQKWLDAHPDLAREIRLKLIDGAVARSSIAEVTDALSPEQWDLLAEYKRHFPIWGAQPPNIKTSGDLEALVAPPIEGVKLHFEGGQINAAVSASLRSR